MFIKQYTPTRYFPGENVRDHKLIIIDAWHQSLVSTGQQYFSPESYICWKVSLVLKWTASQHTWCLFCEKSSYAPCVGRGSDVTWSPLVNGSHYTSGWPIQKYNYGISDVLWWCLTLMTLSSKWSHSDVLSSMECVWDRDSKTDRVYCCHVRQVTALFKRRTHFQFLFLVGSGFLVKMNPKHHLCCHNRKKETNPLRGTEGILSG